MAPAPAAMPARLGEAGRLTAEEAALAARVPVAGDVTVEADSGGHTGNRPLGVLLPRMLRLRARQLRGLGLSPSPDAFAPRPRPLS